MSGYQSTVYHNSSNGTSSRPFSPSNCPDCVVQRRTPTPNDSGRQIQKGPCPDDDSPQPEPIQKIIADEGVAVPRDGKIKIRGACDIGTFAKGDTITIFPKLDSGVAKFVVDEKADSSNDGRCTYSDLTAALRDAANEPGDGPVTLLVMPGNYTVEGNLDNDREINIMGLGAPQNSTRINANATSCGNKGWSNISFVGCNSNYILDSFQSSRRATDEFKNCTMTEDAGFLTRNDHMQFESCFFNYNQMTRDRPMTIEGGNGSFEMRKCRFFVCRNGGEDVTSFMWLEAKNEESKSIIRQCHAEVLAFGTEPFFFINHVGTQLLRIHHSTIEYTRSEPERSVVIGAGALRKRPVPKACCPPRKVTSNCRCQMKTHPQGRGGSCDRRKDCKKCRSMNTVDPHNFCKKSHNNCDNKCSDCCPKAGSQETIPIDEMPNTLARLDLDHTSVRSDPNQRKTNVILTANLWTNKIGQPLHFAHGDFELGMLHNSWLIPPDNTNLLMAYDKVHIHSLKTDITWTASLAEGGKIQLDLNTVKFAVGNTNPIMKFDQTGSTGEGKVFTTNVTFVNVDGGTSPHWLENQLTTNEVSFNNFARQNVDVLEDVGVPPTVKTALDVGP